MAAAYDEERGQRGFRKVTVSLPERDLQAGMRASGKGVTETMRLALRAYVNRWAWGELSKMKGTTNITEAELRWMTGKDEEE